MVTLGIETSCDETAAAVLEGRTVRSSVVASQAAIHAAYGGVVPEVASRRHIEVIDEVVASALGEARIGMNEVDLIAVTAGPGLPGALVVGLAFARALAWAHGKPIAGVHHLEGHLLVARLEHPDLEFPFLALLVSGGHTELIWAQSLGEYLVMGRTLDDAVGEAFDKVGTLLGMTYPAGRLIEECARGGRPERFAFPRPMARRAGLDFSFSGLKTAVAVAARKLSAEERESSRADLAASFQEAALDALVSKLEAAVRQRRPRSVVVCGGVAANQRLRAKLATALPGDVKLYVPSPAMCTDNAVMIAYAGAERHAAGLSYGVTEPRPSWKLGEAA